MKDEIGKISSSLHEGHYLHVVDDGLKKAILQRSFWSEKQNDKEKVNSASHLSMEGINILMMDVMIGNVHGTQTMNQGLLKLTS